MSRYVIGRVFVAAILLFVFKSTNSQFEGQLRLAGPNSNAWQGRVEIFHNGQWGTVCDDGFDIEEATTVCRQMGLPTFGVQWYGVSFGPGSGPIWMDNVECDIQSQRLDQCRFNGWNISDCKHTEDAGVICQLTVPALTASIQTTVGPGSRNCATADHTVRLIGGPSSLTGVVQVYRNSQWGYICDNEWDLDNARVVCRMLCGDFTTALPGSPPIDTTRLPAGPMMVRTVDCTGNEQNIHSCRQDPWVSNSCRQEEKAAVTCPQLDNSGPGEPDPDLECRDGLLIANFSTTRDQYLQARYLIVENSNSVTCVPRYQNGTGYISISIPFDDCGTRRHYNATHIFYTNTIRYAPTYTFNGITHKNTYMVHLTCALDRSVTANRPILPITEAVTEIAPGIFHVSMHFFRNNTFSIEETQYPLQIATGKYLTVALKLMDVDTNLRLVVRDCFATPNFNPNHPVRYPLFTNKCPDDPTVGFFPLNNTVFGFRYQTFKFVSYPEVVLHCNCVVCGREELSDACDRSCLPPSAGRRKKRSDDHPTIHVTGPAIFVYDDPRQITARQPTEKLRVSTVNGELMTKGGNSSIHKTKTLKNIVLANGVNSTTDQPSTTGRLIRVSSNPWELQKFPYVGYNGSNAMKSLVNVWLAVCIGKMLFLW